MSKYRCPACGATHKELPPYCRLCGHSMDPNTPPATKAEARMVEARTASLKGVMLVGLGIVAVLALGAVALGIVGGGTFFTKAKETVGLDDVSDGWGRPSAEDAATLGMSVELPGTLTLEDITFAPAKDGEIRGWTAAVGKDTTMFAGVGTLNETKPADTTDLDWVKQVAGLTCSKEEKDATGVPLCVSYKAADGSDVTKVTEMKRFGSSAIEVDVTGGEPLNGKDAYTRTLYVIRGEKLYVLQARSVYKEIPQFDRMMATFTLVAPPQGS